MRLLLIEDDEETAASVADALRRDGADVALAHDGETGLRLAETDSFDVLIVDRMLPKQDGLALVKSARAAGVRAPVLFLTAMTSISDRVTGLKEGGDDYLVKPFAMEELSARVIALARRHPLKDEQPVLQVGPLVLDRLRRVVRRNDQPLDLQAREVQILEMLMLHAGEVVTRPMLLENIWKFRFDPKTNIVETHMSRLRTKIDPSGKSPLIHTVRGAGYVLRAS